MKIFKKLTVLTLAIAMLFSMNVFALQFPDVAADDKNQESIDVLSSLGIIKGYDDGQFKPDKTVTRAEITSLIVRMLGLSSINSSVVDSPYIDVPGDHWAISDIKTATNLGIIKGHGDGNFGPEDDVTYEQAVKMAVAMLGYEPLAVSKGGWPNGYMQQARDLNMLKNSEMAQESPAPRKIIAQILYNSLEIDLMEKTTVSGSDEPLYEIKKGKNVLNYYLKMTKHEGVVIANSISRLDGTESALLDDEIEISTKSSGNVKIQVDKLTGIKDMLGINVYAYTKQDDTKTHNVLCHYMTKSKIKTTEISTSDVTITGFTSSAITYEKENDSKEYKITLASNPIMIYNGKYINFNYALNNDLAIPTIGKITVTDSGDGNSLINVQSYQNYVVKNTDSSTNEIFTQLPVGPDKVSTLKVPLDEEFDWDVKILKDNANASFSAIKANSVLTVLQSDESQVGKKIMTIYLTDTKKTGKISQEDGDNLYIDGKAYKVSPSLKGTDIADKIKYDASGTFYLDYFGNIAYADFNAATASDRYGYITSCGVINDTAGEIEAGAKIYDYTTKTHKKLTFNTRVKVDGKSYSDHNKILTYLEDVASTLVNKDESDNSTYSQPVKFVLNANNKVTEIDTVKKGENETSNFVPDPSYSFGSATYNSTNKYFKQGTKTVAKIDSKTIVFSVPTDRTQESEYGIKTYSYFKNNTPYNFEVFEVDENGIAKVLVLYASNFDAKVHYDSSAIVVTEVGKTVTDPISGEPKSQITGFDIRHGGTVTKLVDSADYISGIAVGDVISFGVDNQGLINDQVFKYVDIDDAVANTYPEDMTGTSAQADKDNYPLRKVMMGEDLTSPYLNNTSIVSLGGSKHSYIFGTPVSKVVSDDGDMSLTMTYKKPGEDGFDAEENQKTFSIKSNTRVAVYDSSLSGDNKLTIVNSSDIASKMSGLQTYSDNPTGYNKIFVYVYDDAIRALYIIK